MGCDIHLHVEKFENDHWNYIDDVFYEGRNYRLFALLADVRNGDASRGDRIEPISQPRGLPLDISDKIINKAEYWGIDGHSHSWYTLKELLEYDFNKTITNRGYVTAEKYIDFLETGDPYPCCGGVGGSKVRIVDKDIIIDSQNEQPDFNFYCQIEWKPTLKEEARDFIVGVIPRLQELSWEADYSDVRIVFWFDN